MTADTENLVLEHLRAIRATLGEHGERLSNIEVQLSALGQQVAGLATAVYAGRSEMDSLKRRVERIERRLELNDPAHRQKPTDDRRRAGQPNLGAPAGDP